MVKQQMDVKYSSILIHYDNCIKTGDIFLLRQIKNNFAEKFKEFLNMDILNLLDNDENFPALLFARNEINPLKWLAIKEFDYDANYNFFKSKYKEMYVKGDSFDLAVDVNEFMKSYFIKNIYFYSEKYDNRIDFDYQFTYNQNPKLSYITGDMESSIEKFNIKAVFYPYNDEKLRSLARKHRDIIFSVPNYGFNMENGYRLKDLVDGDNNIGFYPLLRHSKDLYFG